MISYYYKFKAVPEAGVLIEKFKDFEPVEVKAETGYYLDKLKNEFLSNRLKNILIKSGSMLKPALASLWLMAAMVSPFSISMMTTSITNKKTIIITNIV